MSAKKFEAILLALCMLLFGLILVVAGGRGKEIGVIVGVWGLATALICGNGD